MGTKVVEVDGVTVNMPGNADLSQVVKHQSPGATQAIVHKTDGGVEVKPVNQLEALDPATVHQVRTNQADIRQG